MKNLSKEYENKIKEIWENAGLKRAKMSLSPGDIIKSIEKEAETNKVLKNEEYYVPNFYLIYLNPFDYEIIEFFLEKMTETLGEFLDNFMEINKFKTSSTPKVFFYTDRDIEIGKIRVKSEFDLDVQKKLDDTQSISLKEAHEEELYFTEATLTLLDKKKVFYISKPSTLIGRLDVNDITISDEGISRVHAEINKRNNKFYIRDMESTNGTFLNGKKIKEKLLKDGDILELGTKKFEFKYYKK